MIDLSVSIVTYNVSQMLDHLLASIYQSTKDITFEVLVVDNGGEDFPQQILERFPFLDVLRNDINLYFTCADNQNLSRARGRHVVSLNPDTLVMDGALDRMVRFLDENPDVGAVTPKFLFADGTLQVSFAPFPGLTYGIFEACGINSLFPLNRVKTSMMPDRVTYDPGEYQEADVLYGACIMARRSVLETVGLKDEGFIHGWDEYDWCMRMRQRGWRLCYVPDAVVVHHRGASRRSNQDSTKLVRYYWDGFFRLYRKYWGLRVLCLLKTLWYTCRPLFLLARLVKEALQD